MAHAKRTQANLRHRIVLIVLLVLTVLVLVAGGLFAWQVYKNEQAEKEKTLEAAQPRIEVPAGFFAEKTFGMVPVAKNSYMIKLTPGKDFYVDENADEAALTAEIGKALENVLSLNMNTVLVDTRTAEGKVIFTSSALSSTGVDAMKILCDLAAEKGLLVGAVYHVSDVNAADGTPIPSHVAKENRETLCDGIAELAVYGLETLELDGYYISRDGETYTQFVNYGATGSYTEWLLRSSEVAIEELVQRVRETKETLGVGLSSTSVWANSAAKEGGSETKASFQALTDGFVDTKALIEEKKVDFVNVDIPTSTSNGNLPFGKTVKWWGEVCKEASMPLYVTHRGENLYNGEAGSGWEGTDELALQAADANKTGVWYGSAFTGLDRLVKNPGGGTDNLLNFLAGTYKEDELRTRLNITVPAKRETVTYEETQQFRGTFDPMQEVTLNGEKIEPSERGGFSVWADLKIGTNTFTFVHKGRKTVYNVERKVVIFQEVTPSGKTLKMAGGAELGVSAIAYEGSKITATLNGQTIQLDASGGGDGTSSESKYITYEGYFTLPKATAKEQNIGKITFSGTYEGVTQGASGGSVVIDKLPDEVDPDSATGQSLPMATITGTYANTYPYNTAPAYAQAILYQLPYGTQDIVLSENGDFYNLRSGKTVKKGSVTLTTDAFPGNNAISQLQYGVEGNDTVIRLSMGWRSPFSLNISPYPTDISQSGSKQNYSFQGNTVTLTFDYVTTIGEGAVSGSLDGSPIFSGVPNMERVQNKERNIYQYRMTLPLNQTGRYYGCHATWEDNTLVLRFNHPGSGDLSGMTVVVDPGHGGKDNGNMAGRDDVEKNINLNQANAVANALRNAGASVVMTRESDMNLSLEQRAQIAHNNRADLFISCHMNSAGSNSAPNGVQVYYNAPFSQPLAMYAQAHLASVMGDSKWNYWNGPNSDYNFVVTRERQYPSILVEFAFLSNPYDEARAMDPTHQEAMANALVNGIIEYYNAYN